MTKRNRQFIQTLIYPFLGLLPGLFAGLWPGFIVVCLLLMIGIFIYFLDEVRSLAACPECGHPLNVFPGGWHMPYLAGNCRKCGWVDES
ncbi:MAG: hypothetical protein JWM59_1855 [Verrucomicrobiales bacterium]|nr:hypothetical protein [Verrucomicrobiales bacterium]